MSAKLKLHLEVLYNRIIWKVKKKPIVKSIDEMLDYINEHHCSVSRYGDGEFTVILGSNCTGYQKYDVKLGQRLKEIIESPIQNHIVCLPGILGDLFMGAKSVQRILGPAQNAFDKYEELYKSAIKYGGQTHFNCFRNDSNNISLRFGKNGIVGN